MGHNGTIIRIRQIKSEGMRIKNDDEKEELKTGEQMDRQSSAGYQNAKPQKRQYNFK